MLVEPPPENTTTYRDCADSMTSGSLSDNTNLFQYEGLSIPVLAVDTNGCISLWNRRLAELSGIDAASLLNGGDAAVVPASRYIRNNNEWKEAFLRALSKGNAKCPIELKCPEHGIKYFNAILAAQMSTTASRTRSEAIGVVCFLEEQLQEATTCSSDNNNDVTEGRLNDDTEHNYRLLLESVPIPIIGVSAEDMTVSLWNESMSVLAGFDKSETVGKCVVDLVTAPREALHKAIRDVVSKQRQESSSSSSSVLPPRCVEMELQTKSGRLRYVLANIVPWRRKRNDDEENDVAGALIVCHDVTQINQQNRAMVDTAIELRQLIDKAHTPVFGVNCEGRINEFNEYMTEITGFSADEVFHAHFCTTFIEESRQSTTEEMVQSAVKGRGTTNVDMEIRTKFGEIRSLLLSASPRRNAQNELVGAIFFAQDTTESAKHDRAVAAMASELRQLIDTANAPIFGIDCDMDVNEWNDKTAEITGYTKEEAFDCSFVDTFIVPSMQASVRDVLESAKQGRGTSNFEVEFRTKSNEIRHILVNATTRRDAENHVVGVVAVAQDVTEAVQRDRAVAGMALELRQLIDTANAPIFGIDCDGNINEWNKRLHEITGYSKDEVFDEPLVEMYIAPSMRPKVQEILDAALQGNETSNYELEFVSKSGEPRFMLVNATTRRDPEFNVVGVVGVAQDVTEDRKHAEELRKMHYIQATQEAKVETERNMTAYFAHELRNPLSAIDSALNSMPDDLPESALSLIDGMQLCTSFMSSVMNNLLDVRKMEEGMLKLTRSPLSLSNLLSNVHKMLLPSVKPGVEFNLRFDTKGCDWVLGDAHRLQQVMTNVVTNAIKYTMTGSILITIGWIGNAVKFECIDTGPGIPRREQEKLFERFVQRGGAPGTGLGLAIAKHIVNLTGGVIRFESDPTVKPGTTCIVEMALPLCDAKESGKGENKGEKLFEEPLTFLIIDDVKMNRMMLKKRIQRGIAPNAIISEASTGEEAMKICAKDKFDVIVVDQYMEEAGGVMVGTDVVYAMRRMRIQSIIIGCSGNDLSEEFTEAGADWVWQKPMPSNAEIISHLREALKKDRGA